MRNIIEARGKHKPPRSVMLQAVTPKGESGAIKKLPPVYVYKCLDCETERRVPSHDYAPSCCSWCGGLNIGFDREETNGA